MKYLYVLYKQKWSFSQAYALYVFHTHVHCLFLQTILVWNLKENKVWTLLKYRKPPKFTRITFIEHLRIVKNCKKCLFFYSSTPKCVFGWHLWALIRKKNTKAFSATLKMRNCICQRCNNMLSCAAEKPYQNQRNFINPRGKLRMWKWSRNTTFSGQVRHFLNIRS